VSTVERSFEVKGKNVLILDDMISTGGTMIKAVENIRKGGAQKIFCAATHGFFLKGSLEKLRSISDGVYTTNSIINPVADVDIRELLKQF
jgi:ribose-phosphate pyrophosphokinase